MNPDYRFPGMPHYFSGEGIPPTSHSKLFGVHFVARVSDALAQVGESRPEHRPAIMAEALRQRDALAEGLAMVDRAIADVKANCLAPEPQPEPRRRAPRLPLDAPKPDPAPTPEEQVQP